MPVCYREIIGVDTEMVLWEITESEADLNIGLTLSAQALQRLSQRKSEVHRKGYLAIRQLLKLLEISPEMHQYDSIGAPYLTDGRFISISHTKNLAAVVISTNSVGIDLEHYKEKIKRISSRFLHNSEIPTPFEMDEVIYLTQVWTAKEALYKLYKKPGLIFREQLCVKLFKKESKSGIGLVIQEDKTTQFSLHFRRFDHYFLTLATR
jgi:4'-phosphopantetheinyl transferase EntD